jgi:hypothetical protein
LHELPTLQKTNQCRCDARKHLDAGQDESGPREREARRMAEGARSERKNVNAKLKPPRKRQPRDALTRRRAVRWRMLRLIRVRLEHLRD